jgi:hypothetical protein
MQDSRSCVVYRVSCGEAPGSKRITKISRLRDQGGRFWTIDLLANMTHIDVDEIESWIEFVIPDGGKDLLPADLTAWIVH